MSLQIMCPGCIAKNDIELEKLEDNTAECITEGCDYSFKVCDYDKDADKFFEDQPSIVHPRKIEANGNVIVAYRYKEIERPSIFRLSELIQEETIKNLLEGFENSLHAPLRLYERDDEGGYNPEELLEIDTGGFGENHNKFCQELQNNKKWKNLCVRYTEEIVKNIFSGNKTNDKGKSNFKECWLRLKKRYTPIVINNFVFGVLVTGAWQTGGDDDEKRAVRDAVRRNSVTGFSDEKISYFSKEQIEKRKGEINSIKLLLEELGTAKYMLIRHKNDLNFIREIDAIFDSPPINRENELWCRVSRVLQRFSVFCEIEASILLIADLNEPDFVAVKSRYNADSIPERIELKESKAALEFFKIKGNWFFEGNDSEVDNLYFDAIKDKFQTKVRFLGVFEVPLHDQIGTLLLINRTFGRGVISPMTKGFVEGFVAHIIDRVRNSLAIIRLRDADKSVHVMIMQTYHTLSQFADVVVGNSEYLKRLIETEGAMDVEKIITTEQKIEESVQNLVTKTKTFYYSTTISAGEKLEYQKTDNINILEILKKSKERFFFFAQDRSIEITIMCHQKKLPAFSGDEGKLELVFSNIMQNLSKIWGQTCSIDKCIYIKGLTSTIWGPKQSRSHLKNKVLTIETVRGHYAYLTTFLWK